MTRAVTHNVVDLFSDLVSRPDDAISLPAAALAIARIRYPELELQPHLDRLAAMGEGAARDLDGARGAAAVDLLNAYVFGELGFAGNRADYYDPRNSFLNDVLERRLGIPITLSLVYIEIGRHCRVDIEGIGFPGHFLVREVSTGAILDPFNAGVELDDAGIRRLLAAQGLDDSEGVQDYIEPVSKRQMLMRMLNNLGRLYSQAGEANAVARVEAMAEILMQPEDTGPPLMVQ